MIGRGSSRFCGQNDDEEEGRKERTEQTLLIFFSRFVFFCSIFVQSRGFQLLTFVKLFFQAIDLVD